LRDSEDYSTSRAWEYPFFAPLRGARCKVVAYQWLRFAGHWLPSAAPAALILRLAILTARHVIRGTVEIATPKFPIRRTAHMVNVVGNEVGTTRVSGWVIRSTLTDSARLNI